MKNIKKTFALLLILLIVGAQVSYGKNNVSEIDISVTLRSDGSAYIVQNWRGNFDEGTENFIPVNTKDISISDYKVSDKNGAYTLLNEWNIKESFENKAGKCGIVNTADGVELCFGISEYGENRYSIEYVINDFIKSYSECDGTNFMFVNPGMSTFPTDGHITILLQDGTKLNEENAGIWAFGYDGYIEFADGKVNAWTASPLNGENSMIVMLKLNKGLVYPTTYVDDSFENVKNRAFEGSDYDYYEEEASLFEVILGLIVFFAFLAGLIWIVVFLIKRRNAIKKFYKEADYFRDAPNNGRIDVSHYLAQNFDVAEDKSLIIGTLILSMINKGCLEPQMDETVGFFGKVKESVNLKLIKEPDTLLEMALYNILASASGEDGILQEKELEKYAYKNPEEINNIVDNAKKLGESEFVSLGGFINGAGNCIKDLSEKGKKELSEVMGLKKYLDEFTLIDERDITQTVIWKEYMVYAILFGIADRVMEQLKAVYPEHLPELENYNRNVVIAHSYYHSMHHSAQRAMQARRVNGSGGRSSIGGGGGFSGGGTGGGSR